MLSPRLARCLSFTAFLLLYFLVASAASAQIVVETNQISGAFNFTNTNPEILPYLRISSGQSLAVRTGSGISSVPVVMSADQLSASYQLTVEAASPGFTYTVWGELVLPESGYRFLSQPTPPLEPSPAPEAVINSSECAGLHRVRWLRDGQPLSISSLTAKGYLLLDSGSTTLAYTSSHQNRTESVAVAPAGAPFRIDYALRFRTEHGTLVNFTVRLPFSPHCDVVETVDYELPPTDALGEIRGRVDVLGIEKTGSPTIVATQGLTGNNQRAKALAPFPADFELIDLVPSEFSDPPDPYRIQFVDMYLRHDTQRQLFNSPVLQPSSFIDPGSVLDLGDTFVLQPSFIRGSVLLTGPPAGAGEDSCLERVYRRPTDLTLSNSSILSLTGQSALVLGARQGAAGGTARGGLVGTFDPPSGNWTGDYELIVAGLYGEPSKWTGPDLKAFFGTDTGFDNSISILDFRLPELIVTAGQSVDQNLSYCLSHVEISIERTTGTLFNPTLGGSLFFSGQDFEGRSGVYLGTLNASGVPRSSSQAAPSGKFTLCLPQGDYNMSPQFQQVSGGTVTLQPLALTVGCRQRLEITPDLSLTLDAPPSCSSSPATISGTVSAGHSIAQITAATGNGPDTVLCSNCGTNPTYSGSVAFASCAGTLKVTATDSTGALASASAPTFYDPAPPTLSGCADIVVLASEEAGGAKVDYATRAVDDCTAEPALSCSTPSGSFFQLGTTAVTCSAADSCGQTSSCVFEVRVEEPTPLPAPPPSLSCAGQTFESLPSTGYATWALGDATLAQASASGGTLQLSGRSFELYHGEDNAVFYATEANGDFRAELRLDALSQNFGGAYRKAGLMARTSTDANAARVMIQYLPDFPGGPALQFDVRTADGGSPVELSSTVVQVALPVTLALVRRGSRVEAVYSIDGGETFIQSLGALAGGTEVSSAPMLVGPSVTSDDPATTFAASFGEMRLCSPAMPPAPPAPAACTSEPLDVIFLFDASGSLQISKFNWVRATVLALQSGLALRGDGSRSAVLLVQGSKFAAENRAGVLQVVAGVGSTPAQVETALAFNGFALTEFDTSPAALGFEQLSGYLAEHPPQGQRIVIWATDNLPNIDGLGHGWRAYSESELQNIVVQQPDHSFLPAGTVAMQGNWNPALASFDGQVVADAMVQIDRLVATQGVRLLSVMPQRGFGIREDLLHYAAAVSDGAVFTGRSEAELVSQAPAILQAACGPAEAPARLTGRVFRDLDSDGFEDAGEPGIADIAVELWQAGALRASSNTAADGGFSFETGAGTFEVLLAGTPTGAQSFEADGTLDGHIVRTLGPWTLEEGASFGFAPESGSSPGCFADSFGGETLDSGWTLSSLGDAASSSSTLEAGGLLLAGTAISLFAAPDHAQFLWRAAGAGDFRSEVMLESLPINAGGDSRKAGLMVRKGLDPREPRVIVEYLPSSTIGGPLLQFRYRATFGGPGDLALGSNVAGLPLPIHLAIERKAGVLTVQYSTDGGTTWKRPAGGQNGSVALDLGNAPLVGVDTASYSATTVLKARFDDFELCSQ